MVQKAVATTLKVLTAFGDSMIENLEISQNDNALAVQNQHLIAEIVETSEVLQNLVIDLGAELYSPCDTELVEKHYQETFEATKKFLISLLMSNIRCYTVSPDIEPIFTECRQFFDFL